MQTSNIDVFIDIDMDKSGHWTTTLDRDGNRLFDKVLPNDETKPQDLYERLAQHGRVLVIVNQPTAIEALAVAVAQDMGVPVGYLPGLPMRRIADPTPGNAKTDARSAAIIAQAGRAMPRTLRTINGSDQDAAALFMLTGLDLDLARQVDQTSDQVRGLYTQTHPALEKTLGPQLEHDAVLEVIASWPVPTALRRAGRIWVAARLRARDARHHGAWAGEIISALGVQSVVIIDIDAAGIILPHLTRQLIALHAQRRDVATKVKALVKAHPLYQVLAPMPGIGVRAAAVFIAETLGRSSDAGAHLASYARLTPVTRRSGSSVHGEYASHAGDKGLKQVMFLSALVSLCSDPVSRTYYDHEIAQGKRRNRTVIALAHRHILTLHIVIRNATLYNPQSTHQLPAVA